MNNLILHSFNFSNFLSFEGDCKISFVLNGENAGSCNAFNSLANNRVFLSPISVVAGDDRSRANFMRAINFVVELFNGRRIGGAREKAGRPSLFCSDSMPSGIFLIEFEMSGVLYRYDLEIDCGKVVYEALYSKNGKRYSYLFVREVDPDCCVEEVKVKNFGVTAKYLRDASGCASLIHLGSNSGSAVAKNIANSFLLILGGVASCDFFDILPSQVLSAASVFYKNNALRKQMVDFLRAQGFDLTDIDVVRFKRVKRGGEQVYYYIPKVVHASEDGAEARSENSIWLEDRKLMAAFVQLSFLLPALNEGGVVCFDAMDGLVAPEILNAHLNMFSNRSVNKKNAQIILATKSIDVLSKVHPRQAYIANRILA